MKLRPELSNLIGQNPKNVPYSLQRILQASQTIDPIWIGPNEAEKLTQAELETYKVAHEIMIHLSVEAPRIHSSGHPGGPLSAFTACYNLLRIRNPLIDAALRMSPGHLSVLAYGLQYLGGRGTDDFRLVTPQAIIEHFRTPTGLPGHSEADIGSIPFGFGPLGKGLSNGLGYALGKRLLGKPGITDVLIGDGDSQEGQVLEAARLAAHLQLDTLVCHADINDIQLSTATSKAVATDIATMFASIGFAVIEVQNGNDIAQVAAAQSKANSLIGKGAPIFIAYYTTMGDGVPIMEAAANEGKATYHGSPMNEADARASLQTIRSLDELVTLYEPIRMTYVAASKNAPEASIVLPPVLPVTLPIITTKSGARKDFGAVHMTALMEHDARIIVLHADLAGSGGFTTPEKKWPHRVINVGAAEANMYMMAAGLRQAGMLPLTYTFAAFGTNEARANARLIDINSAHIPCSIFNVCTHTGLSVGEDGETHQDRNYLNIPFDNTQVWCTADSNQAAAMAKRGLELVAEGRESAYIFMPRSDHEQIKSPDGTIIYTEDYVFDGKIDLVRGTDTIADTVTIISTGITIHKAIAAADTLASQPNNTVQCRVLNVSCIRPIEAATIIKAALETQHLIVVEDHHSEGGLATQVADIIADFSLPCSLRRLGVNTYFPSGPAEDLFFMAGVDTDSIIDAVLDETTVEVLGGEDALISTLYELPTRLIHSRFGKQASPYVLEVLQVDGYIDILRDYWKNRAVREDDVPSTEDILDRLRM